jgi:3'(2'), 5'-bisphosphate nucleotidase
MNTISVLLNPNSFYFKYPKKEEGGCAIWDLAAVSLILTEAGGIFTDFMGNSLNFNSPSTLYFNHVGLMASSSPDALKSIQVYIE